MLHPTLKCYKPLLKHVLKQFTKHKSTSTINHLSIKNVNQRNSLNIIRIYSTQSDSHRQKVVIQTSAPKIVIDKLNEKADSKKLKLLWSEKIDPYIKLSRWDRPIGKYFNNNIEQCSI